MSKFLHLGLPLDEVIALTTAAPARALRGAAALGTLRPGSVADVTLLALEEGRFDLTDAQGETVTATRRLVPAGAVRGGQLVETRRA
jgi:dihydroorotase